MERSKIPQQLLSQSHLSLFLKMVTSYVSFQSAGTSMFSQVSFIMVQSSLTNLLSPLLITSRCSPFVPDFLSKSIKITLLTSSGSGYMHIQCWVGLYSMMSTECCSTVDSLLNSVTKWSFHMARSLCFSVIIVLSSRARSCSGWFTFGFTTQLSFFG